MARRDDFRGQTRHCVMCATLIPADRKADSVTCSRECSKARSNYLRSMRDQKQCRYCYKPSTPEERARFAQWQKWEREGISNEESAASLLREVQRLRKLLAARIAA